MARKEFRFYGKSLEEIKSLGVDDFGRLLPARQRRSIRRGFTDAQKKLLVSIRANHANIETHCRDMIVIPEMLGLLIKVHNGNKFVPVRVSEQMLGHYLGEFALTRQKVQHSAPGIGATKSSAALSVK